MTCDECKTWQARAEQERHRAEAIEIDLQNSEVVVRSLRRQITTLQNEKERDLQAQRDSSAINEVADEWRRLCNHPKAKVSVGGKRAEAVWARLTQRPESFTVTQLKRAVYGCSLYPYVGQGGRVRRGTPKQRFDDLELIMRDEKTVERFIELADRHDAERGATDGEGEDVQHMW